MIVLGITGTIGAGKGTIVDYLVSGKGFVHYSVRSYLLELIRERGLAENRDSMFSLANELRAENGPSYVTDQLYFRAVKNGKNCIIESIRTPGEIDSLRAKGSFYLIAVDADPEIRYSRILSRRSETDNISFETFISNEKRESESDDTSVQNLTKCIEMADFRLTNNGSKDELITRVEQMLSRIIR